MPVPCQIVAHHESGPRHRIIRFKSSEIATQARAGNGVALEGLHLPIMRTAPAAGWFECLYLADDQTPLESLRSGDRIELTLLRGQAFNPATGAHQPLLIGEELGLAPILFLSLTLSHHHPLVLLGSRSHFPFRPHPSRLLLPHLPGHTIATMPLLEERGIACRLAHSQGAPGCLDGSVAELAGEWLAHCDREEREEIKIYACGEHPRLAEQVGELAKQFGLPHQCITLTTS